MTEMTGFRSANVGTYRAARRLVRFALRLFDRLSQEKGTVQCRAQGHSCRNVAFQKSNNGGALSNAATGRRNISADCQRNSNDAIQVGQRRRILEIHDGHRDGGEGHHNPGPHLGCTRSDMCNYWGVLVSHGDQSPR